MHFHAGVARLWLISLLCTSSVLASAGDRADFFQECIPICLDYFKGPPCDIPFLFRLAQWTCTDECKYQCMRVITDGAVNENRPILQYYGKWPFLRYAGMQEPASVAFSVLNLIAHLYGARIVSRSVPKDHPMRPYYLAWSYISMNAWFWSSVFHARGLILSKCFPSRSLTIGFVARCTLDREAGLFLRRVCDHVRVVLNSRPYLPPLRKPQPPISFLTTSPFILHSQTIVHRLPHCVPRARNLPQHSAPVRLLL